MSSADKACLTAMLCASELRFAWGQGALDLVRLAVDSGFEGIAVGHACGRRDLAPLVSEAVAAALAVPIVAAPLGEAAPAPDRRLPHLSAQDDRNERLSAVKLVEDTWAAASPLGISCFTLDLGSIPLSVDAQTIARHFARRELDEDDPGEPRWAAALAERKAHSQIVLDACRDSLDRLVPRAEAAGLRLAIEIAGPWGAPTPREAEILLDEYRGSPLKLVWDEARAQAFSSLGVGVAAERRKRLSESCLVVRCNEAVGVATGYVPGLGDPDGTGVLPFSQPAAPEWIIVSGRADTTVDEATRARLSVAARLANV